MAVEISRTGWVEMFTQTRAPNMFLSRHFTLKRGGVYNGKKVAIDIVRNGEEVAIVVQACTGPNLNDIDQFTTKEFEPPAYDEAFPLDVCELLDRMAGVDPFTAAYQGYAVALVDKLMSGFRLVNDKIVRGVELQASQILQTGMLSLTDENGAVRFTLDFSPKATHFPTVGTSWSDPGANPLGDLEALAKVIRADGKISPNRLIFGDVALNNAMLNDEFKARLDNRRFEVGEVAPRFAESGATFQGYIWIGNYRFEMWSYPDTYTDPATSDPTEYIEADKVVMLSTNTRLDMTVARVPLPLGPDPRVAGLIPGRITSTENGFDVTPNLYASANGKQIWGELESRPLLIPVQIDGFGCLDTEI